MHANINLMAVWADDILDNLPVVFVTFFKRMKLGTVRVPNMFKAKDKNQIAPVYGLLATAPGKRKLVELDVLRIRQWFEDEQRELSKRWKAMLEQSLTLDEQAAQCVDEAAGLTARAKERDPDGEGSLSHEEMIYLQQWEKILDGYRVILQGRRLETERSNTEFDDEGQST